MQEYVKRKSFFAWNYGFNKTLNCRWGHNDLQVAVIGPEIDLTYSYEHLGDSANVLNDLTSGKHAFSKV